MTIGPNVLCNAKNEIVGTWSESISTLGERESRFFHVSADPRESWQCNIFHNSRYGIFHLYREGGKIKLELTSSGLKTLKFRKATIKPGPDGPITAARNKVLKWLSDIREESVFIGQL